MQRPGHVRLLQINHHYGLSESMCTWRGRLRVRCLLQRTCSGPCMSCPGESILNVRKDADAVRHFLLEGLAVAGGEVVIQF